MNFNISWPFLQGSADLPFQAVFFENDLKVILPELFLVLCSLGLIVYGVVLSTSSGHKYPILITQLSWLVQLCLGWTIALLVLNPWTHATVLSNSFIVDSGTTFFKVLIILGTMVTVFLFQDFLRRQSMNSFEFPMFFYSKIRAAVGFSHHLTMVEIKL